MKKNLSWYNVTLKQFLLLQDALKIEDENERMFLVAEALLGSDVTKLPLQEFNKKVQELGFLKESIPESIPPKKVEVNGRKYYIDCLLGNISTAQYIDYVNHSKTNDINKMMSVFLIPEGHKYNDGYNMLQVFDDINDLPIPIVNGVSFFFKRQLETFIRIFQRYSIRKLKKTNLPKEAKKAAIEMVEKSVDLLLLE